MTVMELMQGMDYQMVHLYSDMPDTKADRTLIYVGHITNIKNDKRNGIPVADMKIKEILKTIHRYDFQDIELLI